jgi:3-deoxy-D-manno-octulosonic-acid transferase
MASTPLGLLTYRYVMTALAPLAPLALRRRLLRGKENGSRLPERMGHPGRTRPDGQLVWVHGASVGECLAALPLIEKLLETKNRNVLVTSGTVTSAEMMQKRLPPSAIHQFIPVDTPGATATFLDHWRPDVGLFVDSDLWPNLVLGARKRSVPLALVNARMSQRSFDGWRWAPRSAKALVTSFDTCLAQDDEIATRFRALGARDVRVMGSLKEDAPPLPYNEVQLAELRTRIANRPVLLAAQTHPGEDEIILPAHDLLRRDHPDLLTIIVPRHPVRGPEIAMLCGTRQSQIRSQGLDLNGDTAVYIVDTLGELGLFYRLAPFAFVGGTLVPQGGHNPLEPARLGCAVMAGPHTFNSSRAFDAIFTAQGLGIVTTSTDVASMAGRLIADPAQAKALGQAALRGAQTLGGAVEKTRAAVEAILANHARA